MIGFLTTKYFYITAFHIRVSQASPHCKILRHCLLTLSYVSVFSRHSSPLLQTFSLLQLQLSIIMGDADDSKVQQKTYHKKASGAALVTVKKHSRETDLKLYGSCFWYALFFLAIPPLPLPPPLHSALLNHHVNLQSLRPTRLDSSRSQRHSLSVHRSRSIQEA